MKKKATRMSVFFLVVVSQFSCSPFRTAFDILRRRFRNLLYCGALTPTSNAPASTSSKAAVITHTPVFYCSHPTERLCARSQSAIRLIYTARTNAMGDACLIHISRFVFQFFFFLREFRLTRAILLLADRKSECAVSQSSPSSSSSSNHKSNLSVADKCCCLRDRCSRWPPTRIVNSAVH